MGMFAKTLVAGTIAALLAGTVVYMGMPTAEPSSSVTLRGPSQASAPNDRFIDRIFGAFKKPSSSNTPKRTFPSGPIAALKKPKSSDDVRYYRLEDGEFTEIDSPPAAAMIRDSVNPDASMRIMSVMEQAAMIKQPDLRDRAYLDVTEYALSEGLFNPAAAAMEKIRQVELRDTARARIAVELAVRGDSVSAFAVIDEVEVDELRDIMRLEVIEALIAPRREPEPGKKRR